MTKILKTRLKIPKICITQGFMFNPLDKICTGRKLQIIKVHIRILSRIHVPKWRLKYTFTFTFGKQITFAYPKSKPYKSIN